MHVLHYIAVEADTLDNATAIVEDRIENGFARWSDWCDIGGGRWGNKSVSYQADSKAFLEAIQGAKKSISAEAIRLREQYDFSKIINATETLINEGEPCNAFDLWEAKSLLDLLTGVYSCDSYFYDLEWGGTSFKALEERIQTEPTKQHLVAVDFHF